MQEEMEQAVISPEAATPETENAGKDNEKAASVGKFASSDELLKAYKNLEAEFTKKCQQLPENIQGGSVTCLHADIGDGVEHDNPV